jgi:outer membrane protein OmpA-like peptidoglycan-associated protein
MRRGYRHLSPAMALVAAGLTFLTSCAGDAPPPPPHAAGGLALVVGSRGNMPRPQIDAAAEHVIDDSIRSQDTLYLVGVSGLPRLLQTIPMSLDGCSSADACDAAESDIRRQIAGLIAAIRASAPEADTLEAIGIAARAVSQQAGPRHIVVIDSGLQTAGEMPLQAPGAMGVEPDAEAQALDTAHDLEPSLRGVDVLMTGLAETYPPQQPLPADKRQHIYDLWQQVLQRSGAHATIDRAPVSPARPLSGLPAVTPVPIQDQPPPVNGPCIPIRADQVGFLPNSDQFRDDAQARQVLAPIADKLAHEHLTATLVGTTALPDSTGPDSLSVMRAEAVKGVLVSLGVPSGALATTGVGVNFAAFKPDTDVHGQLIETLAVQNRLVIVEVAGSKC